MIEWSAVGAFVVKAGSTLTGHAVDWVLGRFKRPRIALTRAPANLFQHIVPGTSLARTRAVLGTPHRETDNILSFQFEDALVQVGSTDEQSVAWIGVVLPTVTRRVRFPIGFGSLVLGKSTLADVLALDPDARIQKDNSTKHWCFWIETYFGFSGLYRHYVFGVMEAPCAVPPPFEWDHQNDRLGSDPKNVRLNWVAVCGSEGQGTFFDYWSFV